MSEQKTKTITYGRPIIHFIVLHSIVDDDLIYQNAIDISTITKTAEGTYIGTRNDHYLVKETIEEVFAMFEKAMLE